MRRSLEVADIFRSAGPAYQTAHPPALARKLLKVAPPLEDKKIEVAASAIPPCPCCGGQMIVIETFTRWYQSRAPPIKTPSIWDPMS